MVYKLTYKEKINYVSLGDFLSTGVNTYGEVGYGYSDYIVDYLNNNDRLNSYVFEFAKKDYSITNIKDDIENNKTVIVSGKKVNLNRTLRESDLVTISMGEEQLIRLLDQFITKDPYFNKEKLYSSVDSIVGELDDLFKQIRKYAKKEIFVIGYYNPFPEIETYKKELDEIVMYANNELEKISRRYNMHYINIFYVFNKKNEYLPNIVYPYPNTLGYEQIFLKIREKLGKSHSF